MVGVVIGLLPAEPCEARTVEQFLAELDTVEQMGMLGALSPTGRSLRAEGKAALNAWDAQARQASPKVCAPQQASFMTVEEFQALLASVPDHLKVRWTVKQAIVAQLNARYRCR